jgi:hypothetical protein
MDLSYFIPKQNVRKQFITLKRIYPRFAEDLSFLKGIAQGRGVKAPIVTGVMPEVGRSTPGQGEVPRKGHGGPISF